MLEAFMPNLLCISLNQIYIGTKINDWMTLNGQNALLWKKSSYEAHQKRI